ncbi:MAG: AAA family ATPase [Cytophagales bacterium]|nr:AAA family ATPase [Cytophagales bacterium]
MKKRFNVTGTCRPAEHYMMDDTRRFNAIMDLVERGEYFVINRPRQYGKTTMLAALRNELRRREDYLPVFMSFQGLDSSVYKSDITFGQYFYGELVDALQYSEEFDKKAQVAELPVPQTMKELSNSITTIVRMTPKKLVLLIDEVDASSNYEPFLVLLGMLRTKFLNRDQPEHATFHSVVLAGVHDIKSLKFKLRNPDDAQYNSPWNIAADFKVVMEFYPNEIAHMLKEYSQAEGVQMDIEAMSERLYYYTSGYPFLVSKLCKIIAEEILPQKQDKSRWTMDDLEAAVQLLLKEDNTNFDSLIKNLENNKELYDMVCRVLIDGELIPFNPDAALTRLGRMYGIFKEVQGGVAIHNRIYEQRIYAYLIVRRIEEKQPETVNYVGSQFIKDDGSLDMCQVLRKFQAFMKEQYSKRDESFKEREWRLVFLSYLKPIINGRGYDFKEVETSEEKRMDIVVTYLQWRYIIELKRWSGEKSHKRGLDQLANYLDIHGVNEGWLLIFDDRHNPTWKEELIQHKGKEIFAVWV